MSRKSGQWLWTNNQYRHGIKPTTCSHQLGFSCLPVRMGSWYPVLQIAINDNVRNGNQWRHCSRDLTFSLLQLIRNRTQEYFKLSHTNQENDLKNCLPSSVECYTALMEFTVGEEHRSPVLSVHAADHSGEKQRNLIKPVAQFNTCSHAHHITKVLHLVTYFER